MPETTEERQPNGWTVNTLRTLMLGEFASLKDQLQERHSAQTKAVDAAFSAQQMAMSTALTAAKQAVDTALAAAKEATSKAEENAERRFELFRLESNAQNTALSGKLDTEITRMSERIGDLASRLDKSQGQEAGSTTAKNITRMDNSQLVGIVGVCLAFVSVATAIIIVFVE